MDNKELELFGQDIKDTVYELQYELKATKDFINTGLDKLNQHLEELKTLCKVLRG